MDVKNAVIFMLALLSVTAIALGIVNDNQVTEQTLMQADMTTALELPTEVTQTPRSEPTQARGPHAESLGDFTLTAYCSCSLCCGKDYDEPAYGITATGTVATQGRTIAVDPDVIPLGSVLYINGNQYIAEDTGGLIQGQIIDVYFDDHQAALEFGRQKAEVWIWREA